MYLRLSQVTQVFNFGTMIVPFIVCIVCVLGFFLAFWMPKDFSAHIVAREFKRFEPELDITKFEENVPPVDRQEIIFVQVGLTILSGFIFGFIWTGMLLGASKQYTQKKGNLVKWFLACMIPYGSIFVTLKLHKQLNDAAKEREVHIKNKTILLIASCLVMPLLGMNVVALGILQNDLNRIYAKEDAEANGVAV